MLEQQFRLRLRSAEQGGQDARLFRRRSLQIRGCGRGFELIQAVSGPWRVRACFDGLLPQEFSHERVYRADRGIEHSLLRRFWLVARRKEGMLASW